MLTCKEIEHRILERFSDAQVEVIDLVGDQNHFQATVVTAQFAELSKIKQHQSINEIFQTELLSGALHALSLKTSAV